MRAHHVTEYSVAACIDCDTTGSMLRGHFFLCSSTLEKYNQ